MAIEPSEAETSGVTAPDAPTPESADVTAVIDGPLAPAAGAGDPPAAKPTKPKKPKKRRGAKVAIGVAAGVVVLAGGYAAAAWFLGDRVPGNTTVAGVDISSLSISDAERVLTEGLADARQSPIPVQFGQTQADIDPAAAGLDLDAEATIAAFTGFTLDPSVVFGHIFGLGAQPVVSAVDEDKLNAALTAIAVDLDVPPVEGSITFVDGVAVVSDPADGSAVNIEAASELIANEWLSGDRPLELQADVIAPEIGVESIDAAMTEIVEPLLSAPVTLAVNDTTATLEPAQVAAAATLVPEGSHLALALDGQALADTVTAAVPSIGETPEDAQIILQDGKPTIVPAVTGTGLDPVALADALASAAVATTEADRTAAVELAQTEAEFSTEDAEALGVTEVIGTYSTPYPHDPTRTANLIAGTSKLNGMLILPGEQFSLLDVLRPLTTANGYTVSHVVVNGFVDEAIGGGLSQVSTTTFNAAYEAGMADITHQPHSRWFDRYPEGREATVFDPSIDMVWENNTEYGVLIQAYVADGKVTVTLWGTDVWDVDIVTSERFDFRQPQTVYNESPGCTPEGGGDAGFAVQITRTVSSDGTVAFVDQYTHTYSPWNRVVCGPPPSNDPPPSEDAEPEADAED